MKYKLLVVDIDGTLVNRRGDISAADAKARASARALGIRVVISTGRGTQSSRSIIDRLSLD
ncbi:MAG: HAD hydrolase family protein, partial [Dehalococcoidales bacterium]|nr:HAD hydrolase family protein [Dehalococcoidales bacterium]